MDTIFALSSGALPAAIAVIRLSGPRAGDALTALVGKQVAPRFATLVRVRDPADGAPIDQALALWFPAPSSETGEDMAELQLHGSRAVVAAVAKVLGRIEGVRGAEPGEFTRRALMNGQMDLPAVEALADLVAADTDRQRAQALSQMMGGLSRRAEDWRRRLIEAQARIEAAIDFSDEGDVPDDVAGKALASVRGIRAELDAMLASAHRGERIRDGIVIAIAGPPNAGKSSLLNALAARDVVIVSPIPGTTRDAIEVHLDIAGYPVTLVDTAGIRDSAEPVEQEGIRRARVRAAEADMVFWVEDVTIGSSGQDADASAGPVWRIENKADLIDSESKRDPERIYLSVKTGEGLAALVDRLAAHLREAFGGGNSGIITRERHRSAIEVARNALARAEISPHSDEFVAEELRLAARAMERLLGRIDIEDILEAVFRDFCIGK